MDGGSELAAALRPVRQGNAFEETVERLLTVIKLGMITDGDRFPPERKLADQLGISRLTLREALGELQRAGYVSSRRGRTGGTFVTYTPPAPDTGEVRRLAREDGGKLADALTFRLAVESGAAEILATGGYASAREPAPRAADGPPASAGSSSSLGRGPSAPAPGGGPSAEAREILFARLAEVNAAGPADYRRLDTLFHLAIAELTRSPLLLDACTDARMRLNDLLNAIPVLSRNIQHANDQHAAILAAILDGDGPAARAAVAEHLAGTASLLRGFLA